MECERDWLVEASCPGLANMRAVPCAGKWHMWHYWKLLGLPWIAQITCWHPSLRKRLSRLMECQQYGQIRIWMLDAYKNNKTYFFAEVYSLHLVDEELSEKAGRPVWVELFNRPMPCFFLGSYPLYWVLEYHGFGYAIDPFWGRRWAIGLEPFIPGVDMGIFRDIAEDRWDIYLKKDQIEEYKRQRIQLRDRVNWQIICLARYYPPEQKKPKRIRATPKGPGTPDVPVPEIPTPYPDRPPFPPGTAWKMVLEFWDVDQNTFGCNIHYPAALAPEYL